MKINSASCEITGAGNFDRGIARILVLPGEIVGVRTYFAELRGGMANKYLPEENKQRILLFTNGTGSIRQDGHSFAIEELSLFVPDHHREFFISSGKENLSYLEIILHLAADDLLWLSEREDKFPFFVKNTDFVQYAIDNIYPVVNDCQADRLEQFFLAGQGVELFICAFVQIEDMHCRSCAISNKQSIVLVNCDG